MDRFKKALLNSPFTVAAGLWFTIALVAALVLPLLPIDETRYLTVAWEMRVRGDYILPTLNYEPYHHKPPLLFWLINLLWGVFGTHIWVARLVNALIAFTFMTLTVVLAGKLFPQNKDIRRFAPLILVATPVFLIYGDLIMFDVLLGCCTLLSMIAVLGAAQTKGRRLPYWGLFGLAVAGGILAKGPVILVHALILPLLAPFWVPRDEDKKISWMGWYGGMLAGLITAAFLALSWAIPAAMRGGPEYSHAIFWGQSAGRVHDSFAHKRPIWFFLPLLPVMVMPWIFWPPLWRAMRSGKAAVLKSFQARFLILWFVPVFIVFSLISGKQPHYLIPAVPALVIALAWLASSIREVPKGTALVPPFLFFLFMAAVLLILPQAEAVTAALGLDVNLTDIKPFASASSFLTIGAIIVLLPVLYVFRNGRDMQILGLTFLSIILFGVIYMQAGRTILQTYDLRPVAEAVVLHKDRPLAFVRRYQGQIGYLAELEKGLTSTDMMQIDKWFEQNPDGVAVVRVRGPEDIAKYNTIFSMPYKTVKYMAVIELPQEVRGE